IDDAEPPHTERAAALDKGCHICRAPVNHGLTHAVDQGRLDGFSRGTDNACYSAHGSTSRSYGCVIDVARVERRRLDTFQAIIAILTRIAIAPIACRKHDVDHFTRSHKVYGNASLARVFYDITQEAREGCSQEGFLPPRVHTVPRELDEPVIGPSLHRRRWP